jgi:hypothetical protein
MAAQRAHRLGSMITNALKAYALVSVVRSVGARRLGRLAALATDGYLIRRRRGRRRR